MTRVDVGIAALSMIGLLGSVIYQIIETRRINAEVREQGYKDALVSASLMINNGRPPSDVIAELRSSAQSLREAGCNPHYYRGVLERLKELSI